MSSEEGQLKFDFHSTKAKYEYVLNKHGKAFVELAELEWLEIRDKLDKEYGPLYGTRRL
jgi:hypothetical protein